jgi:regulatory protein
MTRKISSIKAQRKNLNRVNIYLDGVFAFGLSKITAAWLRTGQNLEDQEISKLLFEDEIEVAYQRALKFLSYKPRSVAEIQDKLKSLEFSKNVIEGVSSRLAEKGYVDDQHFAETWVENRNAFRPRGRRMLRLELRNKKVDEEIIDSVLDVTESEDCLAQLAAEKYAKKINTSEKEVFFRKLISFLGRRGFSYQTVLPIVNKIWEANIQNYSKNMQMENEVWYGE